MIKQIIIPSIFIFWFIQKIEVTDLIYFSILVSFAVFFLLFFYYIFDNSFFIQNWEAISLIFKSILLFFGVVAIYEMCILVINLSIWFENFTFFHMTLDDLKEIKGSDLSAKKKILLEQIYYLCSKGRLDSFISNGLNDFSMVTRAIYYFEELIKRNRRN